MPIVMPTQVISIIESLFPNVSDPHFQQDPLSGVDFKQTNVLKGVVNLIPQIPAELMTIPGDQYAQLLVSSTVIEEALISMRMGKFNGFGRLGNINPVATIYNILKLCHDEFPASVTADLSFVTDVELKENILRDIGAIERAIRNAEWKAANVLSGAAIEALLLWKLTDQVENGAMATPASDLKEWSLGACPSNSGFCWRRLSESDSAWVMSKTFRPWTIDQPLLLPARVQDFVGEDHLARFVLALVLDHLDLREIEAAYGSERGQPPFDPAMMTALLLYAYCNGAYSSRRIAKASRERVDFMSVVGLDAPDFHTVSDFRKRHLKALAGLFTQVLKLCEQAGLAKLGHVALDGTKIKANASKHKAMSYERMAKRAAELEAEVARWMNAAEALDGREDEAFGRDKSGDEMPDWVADKKKRAEKIRAAQAELEAEAKAAAAAEAKARAEAEEKRKAEGRKKPGRPAAPPSEEPDPKAQKNFTDPESRIMKTKDGFIQGYNAQAAVDATAQVIVAHGLDARQSDQHQLAPIADAIEANLGRKPTQLSADAGYCSEANLAAMEQREIDAYIAPGRAKHASAGEGGGARVAAMREKIKAGGHLSAYRLRKQLPEPVFGQIKQARGFRQFLLRGVEKVAAEWAVVCIAHNVLKLAQGWTPFIADAAAA